MALCLGTSVQMSWGLLLYPVQGNCTLGQASFHLCVPLLARVQMGTVDNSAGKPPTDWHPLQVVEILRVTSSHRFRNNYRPYGKQI